MRLFNTGVLGSKLFAPKRIYIVLVIFALANVLATFKVVTNKRFFNSSDFLAYSVGAKMIVDGKGQDLYDLNLQTSYWNQMNKYEEPRKYIMPFIAPPTTALLYIPYLMFEPLSGYRIAVIVSFVTIFTGIILLGRHFRSIIFFTLFALSSWFVWVCVWQAQPTALIFLLTVLLYISLVKKRSTSTGFLCAFFILKPHFLIIVPFLYILTHRNSGFLKTFVLMVVTLFFVNVAITGPKELFSGYPKLLMETDNPNYGNRGYDMYSIQQILYRFSEPLVKSKAIPFMAGLVFYIWSLSKINKAVKEGRDMADIFPIVILITLFCAYHVWAQDMALLSIALFLLLLFNGNNDKWLVWKFATLQLCGFVTIVHGMANYYALIIVITTWSVSKKLLNRKNVLSTKGKTA